ncbi:DUF3152 domain-containing protein [Streptomyces prunicolor]|uniref:DUF3152 domain-containing protein n=1 Tax=Streptomyces prunicolor TaxID=67348 RepID=UPI000A312AFE|nr:DUF3152 domain-containing protein [Streptomyces prunicolor]
MQDGTSAQGTARFSDGTPAHGFPRLPDGTPARGGPRVQDGTSAQGIPRFPDGTPAHGFPRLPDGTPARGVPRLPDGTPAHGTPRARSGHPEQSESGGGWGELRGRTGVGPCGSLGASLDPRSASGIPGAPGVPQTPVAGMPSGPGPGLPIPRQRQAPPVGPRRRGQAGRGPRQDYVDAFEADGDDVFAPRTGVATHPSDPYGSVTDWTPESDTGADADADDAPPADSGTDPAPGKGRKGRTYTGIAAAAVTTVLAVIVAGQVAKDGDGDGARSQAATDRARDARETASPQASPSSSPRLVALTYAQKMAKKYPLGAKLKGPDKFDAVPGVDKAPGKGRKYTYRVDVEQGLGLDGTLFAQAVQKTLNDKRSWAHNGARTFERIYTGKPDFVITLASPGTTATWCAKSGLDTTEDNVSCDSAATERVMINAYRWAQGSSTYGDKMYAYRQMLINHEVGHRLGYGHVTCDKDGELAPVMQQQTKFLDHDGIHCLANPWPYPGS